MSIPKHTNSFWHAVPKEELTENGALLVETVGGAPVAHCWSTADQTLIAAAPDMLDALRLVQGCLSAPALGGDILHLINDAITRATGEADQDGRRQVGSACNALAPIVDYVDRLRAFNPGIKYRAVRIDATREIEEGM